MSSWAITAMLVGAVLLAAGSAFLAGYLAGRDAGWRETDQVLDRIEAAVKR